jgi:hypothetical protein
MFGSITGLKTCRNAMNRILQNTASYRRQPRASRYRFLHVSFTVCKFRVWQICRTKRFAINATTSHKKVPQARSPSQCLYTAKKTSKQLMVDFYATQSLGTQKEHTTHSHVLCSLLISLKRFTIRATNLSEVRVLCRVRIQVKSCNFLLFTTSQHN